MGSLQLFLTNRRVMVIAMIAVAIAILLWLGLFQDRTRPAATVTGSTSPAAMADSKTGTTFVDADTKLEELIKRQQMLSQQAGGIADSQRTDGAPVANGQANSIAVSGKNPGAEARAQQMAAVMAARDVAIDEMKHAGTDTRKIVAAMEKLDVQIRAAGMPSVIDMAKFRQMMVSAGRIQEISAKLTEENKKGPQADTAKIQRLLKELSAEQAAMPQSPYNLDALEKVTKSGR